MTYRRKPCSNCPWRVDVPPGEFPAEAFRRLANTAYDMSEHVFQCHKSSDARPLVCAGFLLRGADHNLTVRMEIIRSEGHQFADVTDNGVELHDSYRAMAVANGVDPDDPILRECRQ